MIGGFTPLSPSHFPHPFLILFTSETTLADLMSSSLTPAQASGFHTFLQNTLGPLLIATWVNSMLVMLEWIQAYIYFRTYANDGIVTKGAVAAALVIDFTCAVFEFRVVYSQCITNWGNLEFITLPFLPWEIAATATATSVSVTIVQVYLIWRVSRLMGTTPKLLKYPILGVLSLSVLIGFGGSIWTGVVLVTAPVVGDEQKALSSSAITAVASSAATDFLIAATSVWKLLSLKKGHGVDSHGKGRSSNIITSLIFGAITTGSGMATVSIFALVLFFTVPGVSTVNTAIIFILGRISTLTLLTNLNRRKDLANMSTTPITNEDLTHRGKMSRLLRPNHRNGASGVHVTNTTVIHLEGGESEDIRMGPMFDKVGMHRSANDF